MKRGICYMLLTAALGLTVMANAADKGLASKDKDFIKDAASSGMMEVQLGQMAQDKAQSPDVKTFGSRMVTDHTKANDELKALAQQKGVTVPDKLEHKHQKMVDSLSKKSAADFDKAYMKDMVKDHTKDVADFKKAAKNVKDPDVKAWAGKTLPTLEQHLQQAKDIAQKLGVK